MVKSCCVIGCTARFEDGKRFFRIPVKEQSERRQKWLNSIRRMDPEDPKKNWIPGSGDRVCSDHFLTGKQ